MCFPFYEHFCSLGYLLSFLRELRCFLSPVVRTSYMFLDMEKGGQFIPAFHDVMLYLAYRTGQSVDLIVIGNLVFTPSRDLVFPPIT